MFFYFIRHGESEANVLNEFSNGLNKHPLTEKGRQQARYLAQRLKGTPFTACYTSPILRAVQTAEILGVELGVPVQVTEALGEFDVGVYEGRSDEASWREFKQLVGAWMAGRDREQHIEGGESFVDIQRRFVPFIEGLMQQYHGSSAHLLLVGHGGTYRCMLPLILRNIDSAYILEHGLGNTTLVRAETTPSGLVCRQWGDEQIGG